MPVLHKALYKKIILYNYSLYLHMRHAISTLDWNSLLIGFDEPFVEPDGQCQFRDHYLYLTQFDETQREAEVSVNLNFITLIHLFITNR